MPDKHNFLQSIEQVAPQRSKFDLSHFNHFTAKLGKLIPIVCEPMVPGDVFQGNAETYVRQAPMLAPIKGSYEIEVTHYFVPNRLLWKNWQKFITGGQDGTDAPSFPRIQIADSNCALFKTGTLADYLGYNLPTAGVGLDGRPLFAESSALWQAGQSGDNKTQDISALPFRAYNLICDTYWSDENIDTHICGELAQDTYQEYFQRGGVVRPWAAVAPIDSEAKYVTHLTQLRSACYRKDYFTASLPWTQRGGAVTLPLTGNADVYMHPNTSEPFISRQNFEGSDFGSGSATVSMEPSGSTRATPTVEGDSTVQWELNLNGTHFADLSNVNSATINDLRAAFALQRFLEKNAVGGSRYIEQILAHFGVRDRDARLQRPEYITGSISNFRVSETLQTSASSTDGTTTPQGNPTGNGQGYNNGNSFSYRADEHGYFISLMVIRPIAMYMQGLKKDWFKFDKLDFLWPEFAHLGEQEVNSMELVNLVGNPDERGTTFGYMPRFSEYRFVNNSVHGDFKGNLWYWVNGRALLDSEAQLDPNFLHVSADDDSQVYNVTDANVDKFWCDVYFNLKAIRPLPLYATPKLIG